MSPVRFQVLRKFLRFSSTISIPPTKPSEKSNSKPLLIAVCIPVIIFLTSLLISGNCFLNLSRKFVHPVSLS